VTAAIIRPQIATIDERAAKYNKRFYKLAEQLNQLPHVFVPMQYDEVSIVGDSMQITFRDMSEAQIKAVMDGCKKRNLHVELFGDPSNARYFKNWKFLPADCELPKTEKIIKSTIDVRMPLMWDDEDYDTMFSVLKELLEDAL